MPQEQSRVAPRRSTLWGVLLVGHLALPAMVFAYGVDQLVADYGLVGEWRGDRDFDLTFVAMCLSVAAIPALVEGVALARWSRRWALIVCGFAAVAGSVPLGWIATAPAGLKFFGDRSPITRAELADSMWLLAILLMCDALMVAGCWLLAWVVVGRRARP